MKSAAVSSGDIRVEDAPCVDEAGGFERGDGWVILSGVEIAGDEDGLLSRLDPLEQCGGGFFPGGLRLVIEVCVEEVEAESIAFPSE